MFVRSPFDDTGLRDDGGEVVAALDMWDRLDPEPHAVHRVAVTAVPRTAQHKAATISTPSSFAASSFSGRIRAPADPALTSEVTLATKEQRLISRLHWGRR
ncbi:hypothetical protein MRX96_029299 [Rhipicephalus microplus]